MVPGNPVLSTEFTHPLLQDDLLPQEGIHRSLRIHPLLRNLYPLHVIEIQPVRQMPAFDSENPGLALDNLFNRDQMEREILSPFHHLLHEG